jgi:hypothetical protein
MFVDPRFPDVRELESVAALKHGLGEGGRLGAIETAKKTRHQQGGHLVIGHVPLGVGKRERAPFARLDAPTVALSFDQPVCEH